MSPDSVRKNENFFIELFKFVVIAALVVFPIRLFVAQPFIVSGASMNPTFLNGQYLIVDEISYRFVEPKRGDVVIFRYPKDQKQFFVKRIIGLPGETVAMQGGSVVLTLPSGQQTTLEEPYVKNKGNGSDATYVIPEENYLVLGDNRPESSDSRVWGLLPRQNVIGRAFVRLLPVQLFGFFPGATHY